uniref:Uncharacterized protein n=1 Tax=Utricularia reniformis TaxID=192314 RepID=A0A1Y0B0P2_9LAMI|nr:hypothetical protein AEK19_MT0724 [Utricularia reniformis]ART30970.1 hypothetical protein AEK19_MT0724 [Utricularia reniformis]
MGITISIEVLWNLSCPHHLYHTYDIRRSESAWSTQT